MAAPLDGHLLQGIAAGDLDVASFEHVVRWNGREEWIEMWLRSTRPVTVHLPQAELTVQLSAGEEIQTEISAKFRREGSPQSSSRPAWRSSAG